MILFYKSESISHSVFLFTALSSYPYKKGVSEWDERSRIFVELIVSGGGTNI